MTVSPELVEEFYRELTGDAPDEDLLRETAEQSQTPGEALRHLLASTRYRTQQAEKQLGGPQFIFIEIPLNSGGELPAWFDTVFQGNILWMRARNIIGSDADAFELFREKGLKGFNRFKLYGGTILYQNTFVRQNRQATILSVMRDPIERALSFYDFIRRNREHPLYGEFLKMSLLQVLETHDTFRDNVTNNQLRRIYGEQFDSLHETVVFNLNSIETIPGYFEEFYGTGLPPIHRAEDGVVQYSKVLEGQFGFDKAVQLIEELNREEIAFYAGLGKYHSSTGYQPPAREEAAE